MLKRGSKEVRKYRRKKKPAKIENRVGNLYVIFENNKLTVKY